MGQDLERLIEGRDRFVSRGLGNGRSPCLPKVAEGLLPQLSPHRVMSELGCVLADPLGMLRFDRVDDSRVQCTTLVGEQARVGDLLGEHMLEAIEGLDARSPLVEELEAVQLAKMLLEG